MDINSKTCEILGISESDDALSLLGIPRGRFEIPAIKSALRRRIVQVTLHPNCTDSGKREIRNYLTEIATSLFASVPSQIKKEKRYIKLTELDKKIIATLIAEGGWNQKSRARLVSVARSYNITVNGLIRILEALAEAARSGDGPLSIEKRSKHKVTREWSTLAPPPNRIDSLLETATSRLNLDFSEYNSVLTVKLCAFFAILTLFVLSLGAAILLSGEEERVVELPSKTTISSILDTAQDLPEASFVPMFKEVPTFISSDVEVNSLHYSDIAISIPRKLSILATQIQETLVRGDEPKDDWLLQWDEAISSVSKGWPFVSDTTLQLINTQFVNVIRRSEMAQEYAQQLIQRIKPPSIQLGKPLSVLEQSWSVGMLASIKCSQLLSPDARSFAASLQYASVSTCDAAAAREKSLEAIAVELFSTTEFDERTLDLWEAWILAVSSIQHQESSQKLYLGTVEFILLSSIDLLRESNTRKVLGRIIANNSTIATLPFRESVTSLYKDSRVTVVDLSVLGNIIYSTGIAPWFSTAYIPGLDTTVMQRQEITRALSTEWVIEKSVQQTNNAAFLSVLSDTEQITTWQLLFTSLRRSNNLSVYVVKLRLLNEAAVSISLGRTDQVERIFEKIDTFVFDAPPSTTNVFLSGAAGNWAAHVSRTPIDALELLVKSGATALGAIDARALARAALQHPTQHVRQTATDIIISQFKNSVLVATALLDYLGHTKSKSQVSKLVANLTEIVLPSPSSSTWNTESRRALVQHAIATAQPDQKVLDYISNELTVSLLDEYVTVDASAVLSSIEISPVEVLGKLVDFHNHDQGKLKNSSVFVFRPSGLLQQYLHLQLEYYAQLLRANNSQDMIDKEALLQKFQSVVKNDSNIFEQIASIEYLIASQWDLYFSEVAVAKLQSGGVN